MLLFNADRTGKESDTKTKQPSPGLPALPDQATTLIKMGSTATTANYRTTDKTNARNESMKINPAKRGKDNLIGQKCM